MSEIKFKSLSPEDIARITDQVKIALSRVKIADVHLQMAVQSGASLGERHRFSGNVYGALQDLDEAIKGRNDLSDETRQEIEGFRLRYPLCRLV